jgi:hypothetical protein
MAGRGRRGGHRGPDEGEREREHYREHEREHGGDDPKKHAAIIARRWQGSPPPTFDRYVRAIQQWHALPGAVASPATDFSPDPPTTPVPDGGPKP